MKWIALAIGNPVAALIVLGGILAALGGLYWTVYHKGELHERAIWEQKVEEAEAKRDSERAAAQRDQNERAAAQVALESELEQEKQEHSDDLARALAANSASNAPLGVVPSSVLQPFRALSAAGKAAVGGH